MKWATNRIIMANTIRGKIEAIEAIQTIPSKTPGREPFKKRRLLLDATRFDGLTGERSFENHIMLDFSGKDVNVPDAFKAGDIVEVSFTVEGNKYTNQNGETNYFTHIRGYKIDAVGRQQPTPSAPQQYVPQQPVQYAPPTQYAPQGNYQQSNDNVPF